jgi:hypothetical protein
LCYSAGLFFHRHLRDFHRIELGAWSNQLARAWYISNNKRDSGTNGALWRIDGTGAGKAALGFVPMIGVVSFFADFVNEGGRGISGSFPATLGAAGRSSV